MSKFGWNNSFENEENSDFSLNTEESTYNKDEEKTNKWTFNKIEETEEKWSFNKIFEEENEDVNTYENEDLADEKYEENNEFSLEESVGKELSEDSGWTFNKVESTEDSWSFNKSFIEEDEDEKDVNTLEYEELSDEEYEEIYEDDIIENEETYEDDITEDEDNTEDIFEDLDNEYGFGSSSNEFDNAMFDDLDEDYATDEDVARWSFKTHDKNRIYNDDYYVSAEEKEKYYEDKKEKIINKLTKYKEIPDETSKATMIDEDFSVADYLKSRRRQPKGSREVIEQVVKDNIDSMITMDDIEKEIKKKIGKDLRKRPKKTAPIRRNYSNSFYETRSLFSEVDKRVMKNIGLTRHMYKNLMNSDDVAKRDKKLIMKRGAGRKPGSTKVDYSNASLQEVVMFLAKFKYAGLRPLATILQKSQAKTLKLLRKMENSNYVKRWDLVGSGGYYSVWALTKRAFEILDTQTSGYRITRAPSPRMVAGLIPVRYVASCLWRNYHNVLMLDDFPYKGREHKRRAGVPVYGEDIISEEEMRASYHQSRVRGANSSSIFENVVTSKQHISVHQLTTQVMITQQELWNKYDIEGGEYPELIKGNEFMWVLMDKRMTDKKYHFPDMVLKRPHNSDGNPGSIAVEIEMLEKTVSKYVQILKAYQYDTRRYSKVVWIVESKRIGMAIAKAAEEIGFDRISIVPFTKLNKYGEVEQFKVGNRWQSM